MKRLDEPEYKGKIIAVKLNETPSQFALVLNAGDGARNPDGTRRPLEFKTGDLVIIKPHCGAPVEVDGEELFMLVEDDVLAVVTK